MGKIVFGMMQSLDGYVAGVEGELEPPLHSEWGAIEHEFAAAWRTHPKWVASRTLKSVGTNAALVDNDLEAFVRRLKAKVDGVIAVAGPDLAASLTELGLIDEYHSTFARSFLAAENRTSPVPERRSALLAPRKSARTQSS